MNPQAFTNLDYLDVPKMRVLKYGDPKLRRVSDPVDKWSRDIHRAVQGMNYYLDHSDHTLAIAAPQVEVMKRFFVYKDPKTHESHVIINPEIIISSDQQQIMREGCLSIPGVSEFIHRPIQITVKYQVPYTMEVEKKTFTNLLARMFCHEIDHLDGVLYVDYLTQEVRDELIRSYRAFQHRRH